jgi:hypothetical protein
MVDHTATVTLTATARIPVAQEQDQPSFPNHKFVYELDGTYVRYMRASSNGAGVFGTWVDYAMTSTEVRALNGFSGRWPHDSPYESYQYFFVFPELRNINYAYLGAVLQGNVGGNPNWRFWWSANTTDGDDGTWTQVTVTTSQMLGTSYGAIRNKARTNALNLTGVRGVKVMNDHCLGTFYEDSGFPHLLHFYGSRSTTASRLALWHPTEDHEVSGTWFDWGNMSGAESQTFRVKNLSTNKRAMGTVVSLESSSDSWDALPYHSLNSAGTSVSLGNLDSGEVSSVITLTSSIPVGNNKWFALRITALPTTWYQVP